MSKEELLQEFPSKRIKPIDGLAVTAEVWEEAHEYHRQRQRFHALLNHGPGIVTGLEVIASDPPDSTVYILPGIAVDPLGQTIVLAQPTAYDLGQSQSLAQGLLYLLLSYDEGRPRAEGDRSEGPLYVHDQFGIEARRALPDSPCLELARIRRQSGGAPICNAADPARPGQDEIDLRFRWEIGAESPQVAAVAVAYLGQEGDSRHGRGAGYLARFLRRLGRPVWVDDGVSLDSELSPYTMVYLVGLGAFQLGKEEMTGLYDFLQGGGTVFMESCRRETEAGTSPAAVAAFDDLLGSLGIQLEELTPGHDLLLEPFLFAGPPPGFEVEGEANLRVGGGVILSAFDYGCLWQGERHGRPASREEIRTAMEWGGNILAYALERRQETNGE